MGWLLRKRKKGELRLYKECSQIMRLTFASTLSTTSARPPDSNETIEHPNHSAVRIVGVIEDLNTSDSLIEPDDFFQKKKLTSGMGCQVSVIAGSDGDQQENGGGKTKGSGRRSRSWARQKTG
jgi:hypothetical protein